MYNNLTVCKQMTDVKLLFVLFSNTWNHLIVFKQMINCRYNIYVRNAWNNLTMWKKMNSGLFKNVIYKMCLQII